MNVQSEIWSRPTTPPSVLKVDEQLGRYTITALIGRGGMGEVWKAFDPVRNRHVVIKLLPLLFLGNEAELKRIRETFIKVNKLTHQHICPIYDLGNDERVGYFLVMDFIEGETLAVYRHRITKDHESFPLDQLKGILLPIAEALDYLHQEEIVHRDVKPQNIMVRNDGTKPKLVDFGLADEIRMSSTRCSRAQVDISGTYPYMAPEQWKGRPQDGRTDQYALAIVTYELIAGHTPFQSPDPQIMRMCVLEDPPPDIDTIPQVSNELLKRALAKSPADRFDTCVSFISAFLNSLAATRRPANSTARNAAKSPHKPLPLEKASSPSSQTSPSRSKEVVVTLALLSLVTAIGWQFREDLFSLKSPSTPLTANAAPPALMNSTNPNPPSPASTTTAMLPSVNPIPLAPVAPASHSVPTPAQASTPPSPKPSPSPSTPSSTTFVDTRLIQEVEQAQAIANRAQSDAEREQVADYALEDWNRAETHLSQANQDFAVAKLPEALQQYQVAAREFYVAIDNARKAYSVSRNLRSMLQELDAIRTEAQQAQASQYAPTEFAIAVASDTELKKLHESRRYLEIATQYAHTKDAYRASITKARRLEKVALARTTYESQTRHIEPELLRRYGGTAWQEAITRIEQARANDDLEATEAGYAAAIALLPAMFQQIRKDEIGALIEGGDHEKVLDLLWPTWNQLDPGMQKLFADSAKAAPEWWLRKAGEEIELAEVDAQTKSMLYLTLSTSYAQIQNASQAVRFFDLALNQATKVSDPQIAMETSLAIAQEISRFGDQKRLLEAVTQVNTDLDGMNSQSTDQRKAQEAKWLKCYVPTRLAAILWRAGDKSNADYYGQLAFSNRDSATKFYWDLPAYQAIVVFAEAGDLGLISRLPHLRDGQVLLTSLSGQRPYQPLVSPDLFRLTGGHQPVNGVEEYNLFAHTELALAFARGKLQTSFLVHHRMGASMVNEMQKYGNGKMIHDFAQSRLALAEAHRGEFVAGASRLKNHVAYPLALAESAVEFGRQQILGQPLERNAGIDGAKLTLQLIDQHPRAALLAKDISSSIAQDEITKAIAWTENLKQAKSPLAIAAIAGLARAGHEP